MEGFQCPKDLFGPCSYAMNDNIPADANDLPPDLVLLFESTPGWNQVGGADDVITDRHGKPGANIAFADGHVEFVKPETIPTLRWTIER
ncbi:MAG: H-X9-DG-CTERM domain-containing protein [Planctomycetota bacterium]